MKRSKKYREAVVKVDVDKVYAVQEGLDLVTSMAFAKFDETVEVSVATRDRGRFPDPLNPHPQLPCGAA